MRRAFILGAGLGNRLRPLTSQLPKPLIPVHHRPLISYAFAHLHEAGAREFIVNTHHLPEAYGEAFPENEAEGCPVKPIEMPQTSTPAAAAPAIHFAAPRRRSAR